MKQFFKAYWKTLVFFGIVGLVGGFFTGIYVLDSYPEALRQEALAQGIDNTLMGIVTAVQSAGYGIVLGALGIFLGKKTCLWKDEHSLAQKPLILSLLVSVVGGLAMILPDMLFFGPQLPVVMDSYTTKPTLAFMAASVTYGAVIEEVMLRLFFMSLLAFLLHKFFGKKAERPATWIFIVANIISALLFAAGHLPATLTLLGDAPLIIIRCMLLNGGIGLMFGYLYRKYGLRYSMIAHGGCHIVSKLIWILFI